MFFPGKVVEKVMCTFSHNSEAGLKTRTRRVQAWNFDGEVSTIAESSGKDHQANGGVFPPFCFSHSSLESEGSTSINMGRFLGGGLSSL